MSLDIRKLLYSLKMNISKNINYKKKSPIRAETH